MRTACSALVRKVSSWGELGGCRLGMEPACVECDAVLPASHRFLAWVADELSYLRDLPSKHNRRYLRYRVAIP